MLNSLVSNPSRVRRALIGLAALLIGGGVQSALSFRSTAAVTSPLRVGAETYGYGNADWTRLTETRLKVGPVVISPSTGPGVEQNSDILDRVQRAQAAGQTVYGFIDVSGSTPKAQAAVVAEATLYKTFYGVNGVYLAGVSTAALCGAADYLGLVVANIRASASIDKIAVNAYGEPNSCVETLVDLVHIPFANPTTYAAYAALGSPGWTQGLANGSNLQVWHSVAATPFAQIAAVVATSETTRVSFLSMSESTFTGAPSTGAYWTEMVTKVAGSYTPVPLDLGTVTNQTFAMPTYFNDAEQWETIRSIGPQFSLAIVNPDSGPGVAKDNNIASQILAAQAQGIAVIGYVSTNYHGLSGNAAPYLPPYNVSTAVANYLTWYGVDGIFFDEAVHECSQTLYLAGYVQAFKEAKPHGLAVVNPGRNSGECLVAPRGPGSLAGAVGADVSVNFEGSAETYESWQPAFWTRYYPASKFWHIVFSTPQTSIDHVVDLSRSRQGGRVFLTDLSALGSPNGFAFLPPPMYLNALRLKIYGAVINGIPTTTRLPATAAHSSVQPTVEVRTTAPIAPPCPSCGSARLAAPQS